MHGKACMTFAWVSVPPKGDRISPGIKTWNNDNNYLQAAPSSTSALYSGNASTLLPVTGL